MCLYKCKGNMQSLQIQSNLLCHKNLCQAWLTFFGVKTWEKDNTLVRFMQRNPSVLRGILKITHYQINLCITKTSETVVYLSKYQEKDRV